MQTRNGNVLTVMVIDHKQQTTRIPKPLYDYKTCTSDSQYLYAQIVNLRKQQRNLKAFEEAILVDLRDATIIPRAFGTQEQKHLHHYINTYPQDALTLGFAKGVWDRKRLNIAWFGSLILERVNNNQKDVTLYADPSNNA